MKLKCIKQGDAAIGCDFTLYKSALIEIMQIIISLIHNNTNVGILKDSIRDLLLR